MSPQFAFIITVYQEPVTLVEDCLDRVQKFYRESRYAVILDTPLREPDRILFRTFDSNPVRLKGIDNGAAWWNRFFKIAQGEDIDWTVKMDPDTQIHRRLTFIPTDADIVGHLDERRDGIHDHIQGGFQMFHRSVIEPLLEESQRREYLDPDYWRNDECEDLISRGMISTDYMLAKMAKNIGARMVDHPEIDCRGTPSETFRENAAVTHPHKWI